MAPSQNFEVENMGVLPIEGYRMSQFEVKCDIHCVPKKEDTKLMAVTVSFLNRFSKFFH